MKKVLFIDRDGTLIVEPPVTKQVNSLEEMILMPGVISSLLKFSKEGYSFVIVTNQDGLGTEANPLENYNKINKKLFEILAGEGIVFDEIFCCPHMPNEDCKCRKPKTGMLDSYLKNNQIDTANSYVIGDRISDVQLAKKLRLQSYRISETLDWRGIANDILSPNRIAQISRVTNETGIQISLNLDGTGQYKISTGLSFFDHMLEQFSKHGRFDIQLFCNGDLNVDEHHTVEDVAIALGESFKKALGNKKGIERYAWNQIMVMDEAVAELAVDFSGRAIVNLTAEFSRDYVGDFPTEMLKHFLQSFCMSAGLNLYAKISGENAHHMIECCFKAFAKTLNQATRITSNQLPTTKGLLA